MAHHNISVPNGQNLKEFTADIQGDEKESIYLKRGRMQQKTQMYLNAMMNLENTGRIINMHGDHVWNLGSDGSKPASSRHQATQLRPGQVVVVISSQDTVVRAGSQQDAANWCFFKQLLWPIAGCVGGEGSGNCYGADGPTLGVVNGEEIKKLYDFEDDGDEDVPITIADRLKARIKKDVKKQKDGREKADLEEQKAMGGVNEDDWNEYATSPFHDIGRRKSVNADGKEIFWNMQIFFGGDPNKYGTTEYDGDWCYVQRQLFEQEQVDGGGIITDKNFDNFKLGKPVRHMYECFTHSGGELPLGASLQHLDGIVHHNIPTTDNMIEVTDANELYQAQSAYDSCDTETEFYKNTPYRKKNDKFYKYNGPFSAKSMIDPAFNNSSDGMDNSLQSVYKQTPNNTGVHVRLHDTEKMLQHYSDFDGLNTPSLTVICSCSPAIDEAKSNMSVSAQAVDNANSMLLRGLLEELGRKNLCKMRGEFLLPGRAQLRQQCGRVDYPQYDDHKGITIAAKDDREIFYIRLGNLFQAIQAGVVNPDGSPYLFTVQLFRAFYKIATNSAFGGSTSGTLARFRQQYNRWWSGKVISSGIHKTQNWNSGLSIGAYGLLPFDAEAHIITSKMNPNDERKFRTEFTQSAEWKQRFPPQGGRRRRRKTKRNNRKKGTKRKTRRKKYRKTRKRKYRKKGTKRHKK
tara:strand:- start:65 stop:2125 length:2061 start_codon:yes stop_codon:yes gene_type:complete